MVPGPPLALPRPVVQSWTRFPEPVGGGSGSGGGGLRGAGRAPDTSPKSPPSAALYLPSSWFFVVIFKNSAEVVLEHLPSFVTEF